MRGQTLYLSIHAKYSAKKSLEYISIDYRRGIKDDPEEKEIFQLDLDIMRVVCIT